MAKSQTMEIGGKRKRIHVKIFSKYKEAYKGNASQDRQDIDGTTLYTFFESSLGVQSMNIQHERDRKVDEVRTALESLKTGDVREKASSFDVIFLVFMTSLDQRGKMLQFYDEAMSIYDIFQLVEDIETPKVFIIQADDAKLIPRRDADKVVLMQTQPDGWDRNKLPNESIFLMSTFPQLFAQYNSAAEFVQYWNDSSSTAGGSNTAKCSFLVDTFMKVLRKDGALTEDFLKLAEEIEMDMMPVLADFSKELKWEEVLSTYREYKLSKPLHV